MLLAFFMQVMPFLLVLTLVNISFGVSSSVALFLIPTVLFGMLLPRAFTRRYGRAKSYLRHCLYIGRIKSLIRGRGLRRACSHTRDDLGS